MALKWLSLVFMVMQCIMIATAATTPGNISINDMKQNLTVSQTILDSDDDAATVFNVEKYGAVGDGRHNSTEAFVRAWNAACKKLSATLLVPVGKKFLVNDLFFEGPCEPGFIFKVDGIIAALENPTSGKNTDILLQFAKPESFTLMGIGIIDGKDVKGWAEQSTLVNEQRKQVERRLLPTAPCHKGGGPKHN
ncbi:hypothetical protein SUGI_0122510 [Cryptomeria japonica]|uniref:polygalacturonase-like n=1 Tax=Cryptomeria japonica TaxID=3369 RepID=UPI002408E294|nr:polygalacturonase-like [Cryptomeria japonica]GLJ10119.1 hypothetical protein SUGI_0122510 [Cryptomeria japonica]